MESLFIVVVFLAIAAVIGFFVYVTSMLARRRREELASIAARLGWQFDSGSDRTHDRRFAHLTTFHQGHSRRGYNALRGALGGAGAAWPVQMGDFEYKVTHSNGKSTSTSTHVFSYAIVQTPLRLCPDLSVRREKLLHKLAAAIGFDDIDFESAEFSDRFQVKSSDKRFAYDMLHPRMMEFLLAQSPPAIELVHGDCCLSTGKRWTPAEFEAIIGWMGEFFALWPRHVADQLEAREA